MLLLCGIVLFASGVILFVRHRQHWLSLSSKADKSQRLFEWRKLRRRSAVAVLIAISGIAMSVIYWTIDVKVVAMMSLVMFACLSGVLGLAILDLMSVTIRGYAEDDEDARKKLVEEYHRLREKAEKKSADTPDASG